jgi:Uma2 family endonuclease
MLVVALKGVLGMATRARLTAQDLWRLGEGDVRRELVDGEVVEMAPVGGVHGQITGRVSRRLAEHMERHGGGEVLVGDVGFVLNLPHDPERVRAPDVAFVSSQKLPGGRLPHGFLSSAPDLAVGVLSPSDNPIDIQQKVRDYLEAGARLVWVVAPQAKTVTVYRADGSARLLREQDSLEGEDVLPGLSIPLTDVFSSI